MLIITCRQCCKVQSMLSFDWNRPFPNYPKVIWKWLMVAEVRSNLHNICCSRTFSAVNNIEADAIAFLE